jgi:hypothetical protein
MRSSASDAADAGWAVTAPHPGGKRREEFEQKVREETKGEDRNGDEVSDKRRGRRGLGGNGASP